MCSICSISLIRSVGTLVRKHARGRQWAAGPAACYIFKSTVWVRRSAIRPVPSYAGVPQHALDAVREGLADDDEEARSQLDEAFERFERAQPALASHVDEVTEEQLAATDELLTLDEELRRADPAESLDSDDVIAMEQPHVLSFVHEHIDATLDAHAEDIDVDDVHVVYRTVLVEVLALSYAVRRPEGFPVSKTELLA